MAQIHSWLQQPQASAVFSLHNMQECSGQGYAALWWKETVGGFSELQ